MTVAPINQALTGHQHRTDAMTDSSDRAVLSKCGQCNKPMSRPLVCDFCKALNPVSSVADYFALFGLPRQFDVDEAELHRSFVTLNRHAHPDYHTNDAPEVQQLSLRVSASINDAYRTLKDTASRAAYLLELLGGKSSAEDKSVPDGFLGTMMMMQEEVADAVHAGDRAELDRLQGVLRTQHDGLLRRIAGLFDEVGRASACEAVRNDLLDEIRKQLNAVSYVRKLVSEAHLPAEH